ncbi:RHS repeat protein, partial [Pseudomonas aeruginosa]|nr:RHS repeat protein [Pseudomonas aeruginosa]MCO3862675.1 RHS repeat protein [Pseudomonas aeruginosa]
MQFKLKTLQLLAFLSISQAATAEIYWHGVGTEDKKIKTPSELCNYYAEQRKMDSYERPGAGGQIAITEIRTKYVSSKTRDCRFDYIYISGPSAGTESYGKLRLYRRGDCSPLDTYSHATGACEKNGGPAGKTSPPSNTCNAPNSTIGNPIIVAYGTKKYEEALITEPFPILLLYNSIDTEWKTSLDYRALKDTTTIRIASPSGEELEYKIESGSFTPKTPTQGILSEKNNQLTYTQKHKEVTFKDEEPEKIKYHHSSPIVLERKGNLLTARTKSQEKVEILLDEYGKAKSLETSSTKVDLTYNQNGSLTKRTTNASGFKSEKDYHYENSQNPRLLTGITDENGARYATWTYDDQGRAISSEHANGAEKVSLAYNDD